MTEDNWQDAIDQASSTEELQSLLNRRPKGRRGLRTGPVVLVNSSAYPLLERIRTAKPSKNDPEG